MCIRRFSQYWTLHTNLEVIGAICHHILEQAVEDAFHFQQEGGTITLSGVYIRNSVIFVGVMTSSTSKRVKRIQA